MIDDQYVEDLEKKIKNLLKNRKFDEAVDVTLSSLENLNELFNQKIPEKAQDELTRKLDSNWPGGSGYYKNKEDRENKRKIREERYTIETELLEARHPRRIQRLWQETKPILEERYGMIFKTRRDLARLNVLFNTWRDLDTGELIQVRDTLNDYKEKSKTNPDFARAAVLFRHYGFKVVGELVDEVIGLMHSSLHPEELFSIPDDDPDYAENLTYTWGNTAYTLVGETRLLYLLDCDDLDQLKIATDLLLKSRKNEVLFKNCINMFARGFAEKLNIEFTRPTSEYGAPPIVRTAVAKNLGFHYRNRKPGDDCSKFMDWFTKTSLQRWKATAVDYERLFSFHKIELIDKGLALTFQRMRNGKYLQDNDNLISIDRLPGILKAMLEDGLITENQIDPPLKEHYLKPDELLSNGTRALTDGTRQQFQLPKFTKKGEAYLDTTLQDIKLLEEALPLDNLPATTTEFAGLEDILDPTQEYEVSFVGKHSMFISQVFYWPSGDKGIGPIYRLAFLKPGTTPEKGTVIRVKDKQFLINKEQSAMINDNLRSAIYDANSDLVPARSLSVIVDSSPEQFENEHARDFIAHALLHSSTFRRRELLQNVDYFASTGQLISLGETGRVQLKTFELYGKYAFNLNYRGLLNCEDILAVGNTLLGYLRAVGLPYFEEVNVDEGGRSMVKRKTEDREFQDTHMSEIVQALQGPGLAKLMTDVFMDFSYSRRTFYEQGKTCDYCGQDYIDCEIGKKHNPIPVKGSDLHSLVSHPETFVNEWGNLKKIFEMLKDAKEHIPAFLTIPYIIPELDEFSQVSDQYHKVHNESYDIWWNTQGGVRAEQEELEDNPELKALQEKEFIMNNHQQRLESELDTLSATLQNHYEQLGGSKLDKDWQGENLKWFWDRQVTIFRFYKVIHPESINQHTVKHL